MLVVLDADVIIAGTLASTGACHDILDDWLAGEFEVATCGRLLWEVEKALEHPRISLKYALDGSDVAAWVRRLSAESLSCRDPVAAPSRVPDDPADDYLIQLGLDARAAALVSRDRHFESAHSPPPLELLRPPEFLTRLRRP